MGTYGWQDRPGGWIVRHVCVNNRQKKALHEQGLRDLTLLRTEGQEHFSVNAAVCVS